MAEVVGVKGFEACLVTDLVPSLVPSPKSENLKLLKLLILLGLQGFLFFAFRSVFPRQQK